MEYSPGMQSKEIEERILENVTDVFGEKFDIDVISLILEECNWKEEIAIDKLCQLATDGATDSVTSRVQPINLDIIACSLLDSSDEDSKPQPAGTDPPQAQDDKDFLPSDSVPSHSRDAALCQQESGGGSLGQPIYDYSQLFQLKDCFASGQQSLGGQLASHNTRPATVTVKEYVPASHRSSSLPANLGHADSSQPSKSQMGLSVGASEFTPRRFPQPLGQPSPLTAIKPLGFCLHPLSQQSSSFSTQEVKITTKPAPAPSMYAAAASANPSQKISMAASHSTPSFSSSQSGPKNPALERVEQHIKEEHKLLVLMRGLPGSGKSYLSRQIQGRGQIFSTDDFFVRGNIYEFCREKLDDAHAWNQKRVGQALDNGTTPIIIDNTNSMLWEMLPYAEMAYMRSYALEILQPNTPWCFQTGRLAKLNVHGVSIESIKRMKDRFEKVDTGSLMAYLEKKYSARQPNKKSNNSKSNGSNRKQQSKPKPTAKAKGNLPDQTNSIGEYCLKLLREGAKQEEIDGILFMAHLDDNQRQCVQNYLKSAMTGKENGNKHRQSCQSKNDASKTGKENGNKHPPDSLSASRNTAAQPDNSASWEQPQPQTARLDAPRNTAAQPDNLASKEQSQSQISRLDAPRNTAAQPDSVFWEQPQPQTAWIDASKNTAAQPDDSASWEQPQPQTALIDTSRNAAAQPDDSASWEQPQPQIARIDASMTTAAQPDDSASLKQPQPQTDCLDASVKTAAQPDNSASFERLPPQTAHLNAPRNTAAQPDNLTSKERSQPQSVIDCQLGGTWESSRPQRNQRMRRTSGTATSKCSEAPAAVVGDAVTAEAPTSIETSEEASSPLTSSQAEVDTAKDPANIVTCTSSQDGPTQVLSSGRTESTGDLSSSDASAENGQDFSSAPCPKRKPRRKKRKSPLQPFLDDGIKQQLTGNWSNFKPENQIPDVRPDLGKDEEKAFAAECASAGTQTEGRDFGVAAKGASLDAEECYQFLPANAGYVCSERLLSPSGPDGKLRLDKSMMVDIQIQPSGDWLYGCFPGVAVAHLNEVLEVCGGDVQMAIELMFEWGDSTPITPNEKRQLSDGMAMHRSQSHFSDLQSPRKEEVQNTSGGQHLFQPQTLLDLSMKQVSDRDKPGIEQQIIDNSQQRLQLMEKSESKKIRSLSLDELGGSGARMDLPDNFSLADFTCPYSSGSSRESSEQDSVPDLPLLMTEVNQDQQMSGERRLKAEDMSGTVDKLSAPLHASVSEPALGSHRAQDKTADLVLPLPRHLVDRLEQLFGPLPIPDSTSSLAVNLDYGLAFRLHQCLEQSLSSQQSSSSEDAKRRQLREDAVLAQKLQEEENQQQSLATSRSQTNSQASPSTGNASSRKRQRQRFYGLNLSNREVPPARFQTGAQPVNLQDIMEEERLKQLKHEREVSLLEATGDHIAIATKLKREKLLHHFPGIDERFLEEMFQANGYILETTVSFIEGALGTRQPVPHKLEMTKTQRDASDLKLTKQDCPTDEYPEEAEAERFQRWNALEQGEADYQELRQEALVHFNMRKECLMKAHGAFSRGFCQVASFYSRQAHEHFKRMKEANTRASEKLLEIRQTRLDQQMTLDLHGFHVDEALDILKRVLREKEEEYEMIPARNRRHLWVITGRGRHSDYGVAKIRPAVIDFLNDLDYRFVKKPGQLKVMLKSST